MHFRAVKLTDGMKLNMFQTEPRDNRLVRDKCPLSMSTTPQHLSQTGKVSQSTKNANTMAITNATS